MAEARFQIELCGPDNPLYGYRVRDMQDNKTYGFGLTFDHASKLAVDLVIAAGFDPWKRHIDALRYFQSKVEAEDWLDYDADEQEQEDFANAWPDQFEEWRRWRDG